MSVFSDASVLPGMVVSMRARSFLPSVAHTASGCAQSVVAGSVRVIAPGPVGWRVTIQLFCDAREYLRTAAMSAPAAARAWSLRVCESMDRLDSSNTRRTSKGDTPS